MLNKIQEVLKAKSDRISELLTEVEKEIAGLGLSFQYKVSGGKRNGRGSGIVGYWQEIRKISEEQNISRADARKFYTKQKQVGDVPALPAPAAPIQNGRQHPSFGAKVSKGQKQYWRKVRKIAESRGITTLEARKIMKEQAA